MPSVLGVSSLGGGFELLPFALHSSERHHWRYSELAIRLHNGVSSTFASLQAVIVKRILYCYVNKVEPPV